MTSQQIFAAIDGFITAFMSFARAILSPIGILCAFFAGMKMLTVLVPQIGAFVPGFFLKGEVMQLAAVAVACALLGGK